MKQKLILTALVLAVLAIAGTWFFVFYKPTHFKRNVAKEAGLVITADSLVKAFQQNEAAANTQFLNKAVEVTGTVTEVAKNENGNTTVLIASADAFTNVYCTLQATETKTPQPNTVISVKGLCTGFLSDVVIIDGVIVDKP
ncbi:MAG: OB-fold protein [Chitinophagaceae bacterium]